ncbi:hypothetical protein FJY94_01305 [Candidatus Kaiserbacteria bacterium]|nr:hypothetical protein [Candidatus Kaiserbacteria bacterium]
MLVASKVRIRSIPQGEAPEWVRTAWIGCELPCIPGTCGHVPVPVVGVATRGFRGSVAGFNVEQRVALETLDQHNPNAAAWFRDYGYPHEGDPPTPEADCCEVLEQTNLQAAQKIEMWDDMEGPRND